MPENQRQDSFEDLISTALRDTGDGFRADGAALVTGGEKRGRRARLRRRTAMVGGVAGVALAGLGGVLLLPTDPGVTKASAGSASVPAASGTPVGAFTGDDLLKELKERLPEGGTFSEEAARGTGDEPGPYAHLVFDDSHGAAAIGMSFDRVEPGSPQVDDIMLCPDKDLIPHDRCVSSRQPDGSLIKVYQGYEYPDGRADTKFWSADLVTPSGQHVNVSEWNAPAEKDRPVSRENPPLSGTQLKDLVTADVWLKVVDAIPRSGKPEGKKPGTSVAAPSVASKDILRTLTPLLPKNAKVVEESSHKGTEGAFVVVDDGKGASLIGVTVQYGMNDKDIVEQLWGDAEKLPDGTLITERQEPGEKAGAGVVSWSADTLRPGKDGFRVVVTAYNTGDQNQDATREAPALTAEQLRDIALSPKWDALKK